MPQGENPYDMSADPTRSSGEMDRRTGLALASLVLGIIAIVSSLFLIGAVFGLVGLTLGILHLRGRRGGRVMAAFGIGLSAVGIIVGVALSALLFFGRKLYSEGMEQSERLAKRVATDWIGVEAPDLSVFDLDGRSIKLSELEGRRVVVSIWSPWFRSSAEVVPQLNELFRQTDEEELLIVGISEEDEYALRSFVSKHGNEYPIASAALLPWPFSDVISYPTTFFIDRNGIIQDVLVGSEDLEDLRSRALAPDFEGEVFKEPKASESELIPVDHPLEFTEAWALTLPNCNGMTAGDWDGDGRDEILVTDYSKVLQIVGADGRRRAQVRIPDPFGQIETGKINPGGTVILGHSVWGHKVYVLDSTGGEVWKNSFKSGIDGAHWGDLDGDGSDEMIVGFNGAGGLRAFDSAGAQMWMAPLRNVWNQAVVSAESGMDALVVATEAGGSVRVFDPAGHEVANLRPLGASFNAISAARIDAAGTIQIIGIGKIGDTSRVIAFDADGVIAWQTPVVSSTRAPRDESVWAHADLDGDGSEEWIFRESQNQLVAVSTQGERIATLRLTHAAETFSIVRAGPDHLILAVLMRHRLIGYSIK